jgi:hypothetical protein
MRTWPEFGDTVGRTGTIRRAAFDMTGHHQRSEMISYVVPIWES